ncbi:cyclodeaminase/cyclohydrolase family protein [Dialister pneumosintes]|uniref:Cyclodeaminase/cyclohydrolase domain-containing protein n=1 Tax=Dialister pneumosintes TaxID=39950 RepID=A0A1B3WET5_9FIRM|nr:cyclodeaminase/cyclohydrolase family protein [Dialister pneumosintes]AOH39464.1 hypothetical protein BCB69_05625 [Dialister pneumosintes]
MTTTIWHKKTIEEYLTALGSKSETPAGGVQAAFIGAQACAMACMSVQFTLSNKKYNDLHPKAALWLETLQLAQSTMLDLMQKDSRCFTKAMEIWRLPKETENRKEKMQEGFRLALHAPKLMVQTMINMYPIFKEIILEGNVNLVSDSLIAGECAVTATISALLNVKINTIYISDNCEKEKLQAAIIDWEKQAEQFSIFLKKQRETRFR